MQTAAPIESDNCKWDRLGQGLTIVAAVVSLGFGVKTTAAAVFDSQPSDDKIKAGLSMAIPRIKESEGFRAKPYNDRTGVMTIGYGETNPAVVAKGIITELEAASLMSTRLERDFLRPSLALLSKDTRNNLTAGQYAAIGSFSYNTGITGFQKSSFGANLIKGDIEAAKAALPHSYVNKGTNVEHGLRNRRQDELKMFNGSEGTK